MRYFLISTFFHFLAGLILLSSTLKNSAPRTVADMTVEILPPPGGSLSADPRPAKAVKPASPRPPRKKTAPKKKLVKNLKNKMTETSLPSTDSNSESIGPLQAENQKKIRLTYVEQLKFYIERNKHIPRSAIRLGQSGVVTLRLKIDTQGVFQNVRISQASPHPTLDRAALALLKKLKGFKPLPRELRGDHDFVLPIAYKIKGGIH